MKKLMYVVGLSLMAGGLYAAGMGPFQYDDQGAYLAGTIQDGNGSGLPTASSTTINNALPRAIGQEIYCNTCVNNGSTISVELCVSTGTLKPSSYVFVSSTTKVCK